MIFFLISTGFLAACLTLFLNYCIGKPGKEFSPYEIFSSYTVWLSKRRLKKIGLFEQYSEQYHENLNRIKTRHEAIILKNDFKKIYYDAAEPYFTWERMIGMCPVCFGFWISLLTGILFFIIIPIKFNLIIIFVHLVIIIITAHVFIRILSKII